MTDVTRAQSHVPYIVTQGGRHYEKYRNPLLRAVTLNVCSVLHIGGGWGDRGVDVEILSSARYVLRNITAFTATFTFRRQKYKYSRTNNYEVLQLRHVVQLKNLWHMFPTCACRNRFLYLALLRDQPYVRRSAATSNREHFRRDLQFFWVLAAK